MEFIYDLLVTYGINSSLAGVFYYGIISVLILLLCVIANIITKKIFLKLLTKYINSNKYHWDNIMLKRKVFNRLAQIIPGIILYNTAPILDNFSDFIQRSSVTYIFFIIIFVGKAIINSIDDIYKSFPISKVRPIKGLLQVVEIIMYVLIGIIIIANLIGKNPLALLSGIGALTAVFSLVFKDSIMGLISGIQLIWNDMLRIGDWIEMPKYGADGDVIEISLNIVKIQNFDKTIVTIPAYALISDSFKNWRGMQDTGARRIKRSLYIDISSIKFCTEEMIDKFKKIQYLKNYIIEKEIEIQQYNMNKAAGTDLLINGRHLTNIGVFRVYIQNYLKNHDKIHGEMTQMVRQLAPNEHGLPLEIYAFISDTIWTNYESIQADIFDHLFAVADIFELQFFQNPSGNDLQQLVQENDSNLEKQLI